MTTKTITLEKLYNAVKDGWYEIKKENADGTYIVESSYMHGRLSNVLITIEN